MRPTKPAIGRPTPTISLPSLTCRRLRRACSSTSSECYGRCNLYYRVWLPWCRRRRSYNTTPAPTSPEILTKFSVRLTRSSVLIVGSGLGVSLHAALASLASP